MIPENYEGEIIINTENSKAKDIYIGQYDLLRILYSYHRKKIKLTIEIMEE